MKHLKLVTFHILTLLLVSSVPVMAITMTPSPTPKPEKIASDEAQSATSPAYLRALRDRVASRVAQLKKKDSQIVAGEVVEVVEGRIKITTQFGVVETLTLDKSLSAYYKFTGSAKQEIKLADLEPGMYVLALGPRTDGTITVNELYIDEVYKYLSGRVVEVNTVNQTLKVDTHDKESVVVTVDRRAAIMGLSIKTYAVGPTTFGKIKEGDAVHVAYKVSALSQKTDKVTASNLLHISIDYFNQ